MPCAASGNENHPEVLQAVLERRLIVHRNGVIYRRKLGSTKLVRADRPTATGYAYFSHKLSDGRRIEVLAHRMVMRCLTRQPIPEGHEINHRDGDKLNNAVDNLEIVTRRENARHAVDVLGHHRGEASHRAKLTDEAVLSIRARLDAGERAADVASDFGVSVHCVRKVRYGERWRHLLPASEARPS